MNKLILVPGNSLLTQTPEEGRQLAVQMARLIIRLVQPETPTREVLRQAYANDPTMLIAISHVVAAEFAIIAAANHYWREAIRDDAQ